MSLALDLWSNKNRDSILAVTAHYLACSPRDGAIKMRSFLLAFKFFDILHTGENIAAKVYQLLRENRLIGRVRYFTLFCCKAVLSPTRQINGITMDNASNNNTFMDALKRLLNGTDFHARGNRGR
jgi:hypothetical protein